MEKEERDAVNHMTALQGEQPCLINGHRVRRMSMESVGVLQLVGSPFAMAATQAMDGKRPEAPAVGGLDAAIVLWAHAEDPDTVLEIAADCAPGFSRPATMAALRFVRGWSVQDAEEALAYAMREITAIRAANYDMAPPDLGGRGKKNV